MGDNRKGQVDYTDKSLHVLRDELSEFSGRADALLDEFATAFTRIGDAGKTLANERRVHFTLVFGAGLGGAKQRRHALVDKRQKLGCLLPYFFVVHWRVLEHLPHNLDAFE